MAVASYTTDLLDIADLDTTGGTAVEPGSLWTAGRGAEEADGDNPIQGTVHASLTMNTTGKAGVFVPGETGWSSGDYIFGWIIWLAPGAIATYANGGLAMLLGSSASVFNVYYVGGKDYGLYPVGGWQNFVVDPESTPDENAGTPTSFSYVGAGANVLTQVAKGSPLMFDVFRYGRGEARVVGGTLTDDDATFGGLSLVNDNNSNRWGLFQAIEGGYKMKGKLVIGYGAACDFTDSDINIVIDRTDWVSADFNRIELTNASSNVDWTNISFQSLGTTSKGQFEMMDNCTHDDTGGVYDSLDTFIYQSNATLTLRTFRGCGLVTQGGATFNACVFENASGTVALSSDAPSLLTNCKFTSSGTGHAVDLGTITSSASISWSSTDIGYAIQTGTAANRTILVNVNSGQTLTINVASGASTPTYYNTGTGSVVVQSSITLTMTVLDADGDPVVGAYAYIDNDNAVPYILNTTTNSSGIATTSYGDGSVTGTRWRIRKYGYKQFDQTVDIGSIDIDLPVTLVVDPQQI